MLSGYIFLFCVLETAAWDLRTIDCDLLQNHATAENKAEGLPILALGF
jgi:hypothetical protein